MISAFEAHLKTQQRILEIEELTFKQISEKIVDAISSGNFYVRIDLSHNHHSVNMNVIKRFQHLGYKCIITEFEKLRVSWYDEGRKVN